MITRHNLHVGEAGAYKCITTDCDNFEVFIGILDDELPLACKKPLSEMRETLKLLRDRRTLRQCTDDKMSSNNSVVDVPRSSYSPFKATVTPKQKGQKDFTKPSRSNSSKILAHSMSTDSGISIGRSDSVVSSDREDSLLKLNSTQSEDLAPIEETPLDNDNQSNGVTSTTSPPIFSSASSTMSDRIRNLWLEAKQKEAVEISLKDDIEQLRGELDRTVREKQNAESELHIKQEEVTQLTSAMKREKRKLENKTDEVDGLRIQVADGETSREKLAKQVVDINRQLLTQKSKYEDEILAYQLEATNLRATIEEKERIICKLRSKMLFFERRNALLQRSNSYEPGEEREAEDGEGVDVVVVQRSSSYDLREEIQQTKEKLHLCEKQLSQEQSRQFKTEEKLHQCEQQLSKEKSRQSTYMMLIGLLVVVIAIVVYLYMYHRDDVQCCCKGLSHAIQY
jgi:hypothetical protein